MQQIDLIRTGTDLLVMYQEPIENFRTTSPLEGLSFFFTFQSFLEFFYFSSTTSGRSRDRVSMFLNSACFTFLTNFMAVNTK